MVEQIEHVHAELQRRAGAETCVLHDRQIRVEEAGADDGISAQVAETVDGVVGFCGFAPSRDDDDPAHTAEVLTIYLLRDAAGRGIGRELFASAVGRLAELGYERATLWVMASNDRSRRFYEAAGWSWDGTTSEHRFDCANVPIVRYVLDL